MKNRPDKPPYGSPCNGCGQCCEDRLCVVGERLFGAGRVPCPALQFESSVSSSCGVIVSPQKFCLTRARIHGTEATRQAAIVLIGAGAGCDALLIGEDRPPGARDRMAHAAVQPGQDRIDKALKVFGLKGKVASDGL